MESIVEAVIFDLDGVITDTARYHGFINWVLQWTPFLILQFHWAGY